MKKGNIDAVVTWVDGNDPLHRAKRDMYSDQLHTGTTRCGALELRFVEAGEVRYCIYSIRKFAPWIRNIYLVTDEQRPSWLSEELQKLLGVTVVDHKVLFRDNPEYLPCFNSISITTLLWKIPGISDKYILFNDDVFLVSKTEQSDFFVGEKVVLRGRFVNQRLSLLQLIKKAIRKWLLFQKGIKVSRVRSDIHVNAARLAGETMRYFEAKHTPIGYKCSIQENYYRNNRNKLELNISFKFRNEQQFLSSVLHSHLALSDNMAVVYDGSDSRTIIPRCGGLGVERKKLRELKENSRVIKILCFQDLIFLKREAPDEFNEVVEWLEETIVEGGPVSDNS